MTDYPKYEIRIVDNKYTKYHWSVCLYKQAKYRGPFRKQVDCQAGSVPLALRNLADHINAHKDQYPELVR